MSQSDLNNLKQSVNTPVSHSLSADRFPLDQTGHHCTNYRNLPGSYILEECGAKPNMNPNTNPNYIITLEECGAAVTSEGAACVGSYFYLGGSTCGCSTDQCTARTAASNWNIYSKATGGYL